MKPLAITFVSHNDNEILIYAIKNLVSHTNFTIPTDIHVFVQACSKAYIRSLENLLVHYNKKNHSAEFILHTNTENIGISKASNILYNFTKDYKYVLALEDDWFVVENNEMWLDTCIKFLEVNTNVSTIALRKYVDDKEKYQYGWTRYIHYKCFKFVDNFNYQNKLGEQIEFENNSDKFTFTKINNFLFTYNPTIRRNEDYKTIFPLSEFDETDTSIHMDENNRKIHDSAHWGSSESLTMEKTISFHTFMLNQGIFGHYDDWIDYFKDNSIGPYSNDYKNIVNINSNFPVLLIHAGDSLPVCFKRYKHDYIRPIHFLWNGSNTDDITTILVDYKPRSVFIAVKEDIEEQDKEVIKSYFVNFLPYEYKSKIFYYQTDLLSIKEIEQDTFSVLNSTHIEPLISVITPSYESKHRIQRPFRSLLKQSYTNWEWIILDDSKTDETWKTLCDFALTDPRIKVFKRDRNNGSIGDNKLHCAKLSFGDFIFELDHDDDIMPNTFEVLVKASIKYPEAKFFYSDCAEIFEDSMNTFRYGEYFGLGFGAYYRQWFKNDFHYIYKTHRMNPHTFRHIVGVPNHFRCWKRDAYFEVKGNNPALQVADDYDLILKTMLKYRWCHIPEFLYVQYRNEGGDNFTFHRNGLIQYLVGQLQQLYEEDIHKRLTDLGVDDDVYNNKSGYPLDYEVNTFQYPLIDYVYRDRDTEMNPLISVVIPTYNRPEDLEKALDSVFSQSYQNFEVLVVGDACPMLDEFVKTYKYSKDNRFKYYNLTKNYGVGGSVPRNYALKVMCSTKWVAYLDDDNVWKQNHLQVVVDTIRRNKDVSFIVNSMIIDDKEIIFDELRRGRIDTSSVVHKFELCVKYGLWKDRNEAGYAHDFEFFNRWREEEKVFTKIPTLIYNTKYNSQSYEELSKM